ncbi:hypothetical protein IEO21_08190 [Rhodonia placenta]|uniref:Uncharacterized protein n=1 Tax=Rhodonia placenta TaxID=104341 RepID=A0A8H7NWN5_9APHY|nr:hypothetical protein IEO21_08190 [Postia placenta]
MSGDNALSTVERLAESGLLFGTLDEDEERQRDRQLFFERCGYMLRPRYCPGWVPSWRKKMENVLLSLKMVRFCRWVIKFQCMVDQGSPIRT